MTKKTSSNSSSETRGQGTRITSTHETNSSGSRLTTTATGSGVKTPPEPK